MKVRGGLEEKRSGERGGQAVLASGTPVLFTDRKGRRYLRVLEPGRTVSVKGGRISCDEVIGKRDGEAVESSLGERFLVLSATFYDLVPRLPRRAQVIYPKDAGQIIVRGDIYPGATVVEVGVGAGAMTIALLRAVGPMGRVVSYERRADFLEMARRNVETFCRGGGRWELVERDAEEGIEVREADRMVVDVPEPWKLVDQAAACLRPGGVLVSFIPTVLQLKAIHDALLSQGSFALIEAVETLERSWHVEGQSIRPQHRMVAHTGFVVSARKMAGRL